MKNKRKHKRKLRKTNSKKKVIGLNDGHSSFSYHPFSSSRVFSYKTSTPSRHAGKNNFSFDMPKTGTFVNDNGSELSDESSYRFMHTTPTAPPSNNPSPNPYYQYDDNYYEEMLFSNSPHSNKSYKGQYRYNGYVTPENDKDYFERMHVSNSPSSYTPESSNISEMSIGSSHKSLRALNSSSAPPMNKNQADKNQRYSPVYDFDDNNYFEQMLFSNSPLSIKANRPKKRALSPENDDNSEVSNGSSHKSLDKALIPYLPKPGWDDASESTHKSTDKALVPYVQKPGWDDPSFLDSLTDDAEINNLPQYLTRGESNTPNRFDPIPFHPRNTKREDYFRWMQISDQPFKKTHLNPNFKRSGGEHYNFVSDPYHDNRMKRIKPDLNFYPEDEDDSTVHSHDSTLNQRRNTHLYSESPNPSTTTLIPSSGSPGPFTTPQALFQRHNNNIPKKPKPVSNINNYDNKSRLAIRAAKFLRNNPYVRYMNERARDKALKEGTENFRLSPEDVKN